LTNYLFGLGLKNYRGIGNSYVELPCFGRFNIFIGPNNAGKSSILNFINEQLPISGHAPPTAGKKLAELDRNQSGGAVGLLIQIPKNELVKRVRSSISNDDPNISDLLETVCSYLCQPSGGMWIEYSEPFKSDKSSAYNINMDGLASVIHRSQWNNIWSVLTSMRGGGLTNTLDSRVDTLYC